jgi:hypothetical protein
MTREVRCCCSRAAVFEVTEIDRYLEAFESGRLRKIFLFVRGRTRTPLCVGDNASIPRDTPPGGRGAGTWFERYEAMLLLKGKLLAITMIVAGSRAADIKFEQVDTLIMPICADSVLECSLFEAEH